MRNLLILFLILAVTCTTQASLSIVAPTEACPGKFTIGVNVVNEKALLTGLIVIEGDVSIDVSNVHIVNIPYISQDPFIEEITGDTELEAFLADQGITDPTAIFYYEVVHVGIPPLDIPDGELISNIEVSFDCIPYVTTTLIDMASIEVIDTARTIVCYIPEPTTITLLALGGFFLRRRR